MRVVGALAAVGSALLFERIARRHFGDSARWGALWFGAGTAADLLIGRLTFAVGVTFALAAVFALQRGYRRSGLVLATGCTLGSPVAGLFLALAGVAYWLATRARLGLWVAAAAMIPAVALALLFPEGGSQPYSFETLLSIVLSCGLLLWLLPKRERALRSAALLYLGAGLLAFVIATPMGGNASRLGVAFAGPLLLCAVLSAAAPRRVLVAAMRAARRLAVVGAGARDAQGRGRPVRAGGLLRAAAELHRRARGGRGARRGAVHAPALGVGLRRRAACRSRAAG